MITRIIQDTTPITLARLQRLKNKTIQNHQRKIVINSPLEGGLGGCWFKQIGQHLPAQAKRLWRPPQGGNVAGFPRRYIGDMTNNILFIKKSPQNGDLKNLFYFQPTDIFGKKKKTAASKEIPANK